MCGFAGLVNTQGSLVNEALLSSMSQTLAHRGPDDSGQIILNNSNVSVGLGFRRLSIIDLSECGHQPMKSQDGNFWMIYNGEVYNAPELRKEKLQGVNLRGTSDSEIILELFSRYGEESLTWLNGMFAIAIWNISQQRLMLVRDPVGIKPLYLSRMGSELAFASEVKALFKHPQIKPKINPQAVHQYFHFQFSLENRTFFENIESLEPGKLHVFTFSKGEYTEKARSLWSFLPTASPNELSSQQIEELAQELRTLIKSTIQRQTRSDVQVGAFLSGGMDTGSITALAKPFLPDLTTFTCGFNTQDISLYERNNDERSQARDLAQTLGTNHHEIVLDSNSIRDLLKETVWHMEDPKVGVSYQILAMAKKVKAEKTTVVLSGTGGDELFGGYTWRYLPIMEMDDYDKFCETYFQGWGRILSPEEQQIAFHTEFKKTFSAETTFDEFKNIFLPVRDSSPLNRSLHFDLHYFLRGLLIVDDKLNMAASVECRVPLLDLEIVEFAMKLPASLKFDNHQGKVILKKALAGILPGEVIQRRKQGFTPPDEAWFAGPNAKWTSDILLSDQFLDRKVFTKEFVQDLLEKQSSGLRASRFLLWSLLCLNSVFELFIDGKDPCQ